MLKREGFTLIELLVVVLIIGILAAIAFPFYDQAVDKSRAAEAVINSKVIFEAIERYRLTHNALPTDFEELDVSFGTACAGTACSAGKYTYSISLIGGSNRHLNAYRGPAHSSAYFSLMTMTDDGPVGGIQLKKGEIICAPRDKPRDIKLCKALGGKTVVTVSSQDGYILGR